MIHFLLLATLAAAAPKLSLQTVVREALDNSPQLRAQRTQTNLAYSDRWRRFLINEPTLSYTAADNTSQIQYGLSVPIAFPGKSFALTTLDGAKYRVERAEQSARRYEVVSKVTAAYLECASANATMAMQTQTVDDLEEVFTTLRALYESGHSTQAEKIGAELQSRQARSDLDIARFREINSCRKFADLWKIESGRDVGEVAMDQLDLELPDDIDAELLKELGPRTADEARAEAAAGLAQASASTATWSQAPDLTVTAVRNHYRYPPASPNGKIWTTGITVSLTLPLLYPFAEGAEVRRIKSRAALDENAAFVARVNARSDVTEAKREYQHARARLKDLRAKDLTLGEALAESTSSAYRQGRLGFAELILSRKTLADLRAQDIALRGTIIDAHLRCLDQCDAVLPAQN